MHESPIVSDILCLRGRGRFRIAEYRVSARYLSDICSALQFANYDLTLYLVRAGRARARAPLTKPKIYNSVNAMH